MRKYFFCAANSKLLKQGSIFQKSPYYDTIAFQTFLSFKTLLAKQKVYFEHDLIVLDKLPLEFTILC